MPRFSTTTALAGAATAFLLVASAPLAGAVPTDTAEPHVVTYDASQAEEFQTAVDEAAATWNEQVTNVKFEKATDGQADLTVVADDGWPRAQVEDLGAGTVWMGREAVNERHHIPRIATHEIGHILGLPDNRTGVCEDLMSGASAGTDCQNNLPNPEEKAEVEQNFAQGVAIAPQLLSEAPANR
ncbi:snapalysin family zinc-dependent metalloprotease [Saccharopolyspora rhizosphaerae]|uniref:Extracellular small neutral protease n=1 Tax=Saccharopolyspora rhizosphaerae TaxID=2492662 RepID=A0A426JM49_9PSEU|nr:snapalysin family zinc-dependent metalloprotease [Saccharopolyspora rhizosphaerae]RRO14303.1 snapalysin family zinc-dependent metalloprotease [Saccharopolyspora rhizosphaerae]